MDSVSKPHTWKQDLMQPPQTATDAQEDRITTIGQRVLAAENAMAVYSDRLDRLERELAEFRDAYNLAVANFDSQIAALQAGTTVEGGGGAAEEAADGAHHGRGKARKGHGRSGAAHQ